MIRQLRITAAALMLAAFVPSHSPAQSPADPQPTDPRQSVDAGEAELWTTSPLEAADPEDWLDGYVSASPDQGKTAGAVVSVVKGGHLMLSSDRQEAVLVTGASSGIGLLTTKYLAERGFHVYAGARKDADLKRLDAMDNVLAVRLDVTKESDIDAAVHLVRKQGRGLFGIVNNAGVAAVGTLETVPDEDVLWMHDVNVMGPLRINRAFLPLLKKSKGRTLTIGSLSGYVISPSGGAYSMSKFAVEAYTDTLASELSESGVSVGVVDPGPYRSRGREKVAMRMLTGSPDLEQELTADQEAIYRNVKEANDDLKEPHEVAEAVVHFLTSDSPRLRYMVAPDKATADASIRAALQRIVQLNADQPFELSRAELIRMLDQLLAARTEHAD